MTSSSSTTAARPEPATRAVRWRCHAIVISTIGTAVTLLLSDLLDPVGDGTPTNLLAGASDHTAAMVGSSLLLVLSAVLLVPAVVGMLRLARGRGAGAVNVGAVLLVLGAFGHAMAAAFYLLVSAMPAAGVAPEVTTALLAHVEQAPNLIVVFLLILSFAIGLLVTFGGLRRAGQVPIWVLGAVVAAFAIEVVGPPGAAVALVKQGLTLLAFAYVARQLLRQTPQTPQTPQIH